MNRVLRLAASVPWAISPEWLQQILAIANREGPGPEAVAAQLGRPLENTHAVAMHGSVAVIPVVGPVMRYASLFTEISGAVSVDTLARDLRVALEDDEVSAILFDIDSPGGEVSGIHELADMIASARAVKPCAVYAGGRCASAAYWLASAAGSITCDATAILGSIGVVMALPNPAAVKAEEIEIVSSNAPNKRPDVSTDEGRATVLATVDALASVFTADVARFRGVTPEQVTSDFGGGGVFVGADAVRVGLADRLGSFEDALAALGARAPAPASPSSPLRTSPMSLHRTAPSASAPVPRAAEDAPPPAQEPGKAPPADDKPAEQSASEPQSCGGCAALNAAGSKFCSTCGAAFPPPKTGEEEPASSSDEGEDMGARALASITGQPTLSSALGVVHAWKHTATEEAPTLRAEVAKLRERLSAIEADQIIAKAKDERKLSPALEKQLRALALISPEQARAFAEALSPIIALQPTTKQPEAQTTAGGMHWKGKAYGALSPMEKHELATTDPQLFAIMSSTASKS